MRGVTWAAFGFGTLNSALFLALVLREELLDVAMDMPHAIAVLWGLSIAGAHWSLGGADLARFTHRDVARMIVRGTLAGALVGAGTAAAAFLFLPIALLYGAILGLGFGLAFALLDVIALAIVRAMRNARSTL